jgi:hypothetical protein
VGLLAGAGGWVRFEVAGVNEDGTAQVLSPTAEIAASDSPGLLDVDLSPAAGAEVLRLRVVALNPEAGQDWAVWVDPQVEGRPVD